MAQMWLHSYYNQYQCYYYRLISNITLVSLSAATVAMVQTPQTKHAERETHTKRELHRKKTFRTASFQTYGEWPFYGQSLTL